MIPSLYKVLLIYPNKSMYPSDPNWTFHTTAYPAIQLLSVAHGPTKSAHVIQGNMSIVGYYRATGPLLWHPTFLRICIPLIAWCCLDRSPTPPVFLLSFMLWKYNNNLAIVFLHTKYIYFFYSLELKNK